VPGIFCLDCVLAYELRVSWLLLREDENWKSESSPWDKS
jgi:hypothetical protein